MTGSVTAIALLCTYFSEVPALPVIVDAVVLPSGAAVVFAVAVELVFDHAEKSSEFVVKLRLLKCFSLLQ
jgi:hypothetical protein